MTKKEFRESFEPEYEVGYDDPFAWTPVSQFSTLEDAENYKKWAQKKYPGGNYSVREIGWELEDE